jgi:GLPGLI family protein
MKQFLLTIAISMFAAITWGQEKSAAQITSGKITYEEKIKLEIKLEGEAAQLAANFPKERIAEKILLFTDEETLFQTGKNISDEMNAEHSEGIMIKVSGSGDDKLYTDLKNNKIIEQRDFMNRMFLIEKPIPESGWKITGNQKVILGYPCMEASKTDTAGQKTVVWFAPSIPIKGGPAGFVNLPGMVLEVNVKNNSRTYIAKSVEQVTPEVLKIQKPKDGKKITDEEFKAVVSEKMKEMGMPQGKTGSGAQMHIIIKQ